MDTELVARAAVIAIWEELIVRFDRAETQARRASSREVSKAAVSYLNGCADTYESLATAARDELARYQEMQD